MGLLGFLWNLLHNKRIEITVPLGKPKETDFTPSMPVLQRITPNCKALDKRVVKCVVIHSTGSSTAESAINWMGMAESGVSAHYCIGKDGKIYQLVREQDIAYHAGAAQWNGSRAVNLISIGIELVNLNDGKDHYPAPQMMALTRLVEDILKRHELKTVDVTAHKYIALPLGRKTDPAGFLFYEWRDSLKVD